MNTRKQTRSVMESVETRRMMAADLYLSAVNVEAAVIPTSEPIGSSLVINNRGNTAAPSGISVRMVYSKDRVFGNADDMPLGTVTTAEAVPAGGSITVNVNPRRPSGLQGGEFYVGAYVDPYNRLAEKQEANNTAFSSNVVTHYGSLGLFKQNGFILGTSGNDTMYVSVKNDILLIKRNNFIYGESAANYSTVKIDAGAGNDVVIATPDFPIKLAVTGSSGDDVLIGGAMNDEISGANGRDRVFGGGGNDLLIGGGGNDRLYGEDGDDVLSGHGGNDLLFGGAGANRLYGAAGNDRLNGQGNNAIDILDGGPGTDTAIADPNDILNATEA